MLIYTVELQRRGAKNPAVTIWEGKAVNLLDALQLARQSVWPVLHTAKVIDKK